MPLPPLRRTEAETQLSRYCETRIPEHVRDQIKLSYSFRGNDVTLIEERPRWDDSEAEWTNQPVALFRFDPKKEVWNLKWRRANGRWEPCDWFRGSKRFKRALEEVERDPYCTFWG
jgi:hypothetical protein